MIKVDIFIEKKLTTLFDIVGRQYPSEILSKLLNKQVLGLTICDFVNEHKRYYQTQI